MNVDNQNGVAFGRRGREIRDQPVLVRPTAKPVRSTSHIPLVFVLMGLLLAASGAFF